MDYSHVDDPDAPMTPAEVRREYAERIDDLLQVLDTYETRRLLEGEIEALRKQADDMQNWLDNIIPRE